MIEGYEVRNVIRKNRKSGGVAIYINKSVNFKSMNCMSMKIDNNLLWNVFPFNCVLIEGKTLSLLHVSIEHAVPTNMVAILIRHIMCIQCSL